MNKKTNKKNLMALLILILAGIFVWVGFSVYFTVTGESNELNVESYTKHLKPNFDLEAIETVKERIDNNFKIDPQVFLEYKKQ